jgi:hypothetical protein
MPTAIFYPVVSATPVTCLLLLLLLNLPSGGSSKKLQRSTRTPREPRRQEVTCKLLLLLAQIMAVSSLIGAPFGYAVAPLLPLRTVASDTKELRAGLAKGKGV